MDVAERLAANATAQETSEFTKKMCAPDLQTNLLSIRACTSNGYSVEFSTKRRCWIKTENRKV